MAGTELVDRLAAHGVLRRLNDGDLTVTAGTLVDGRYILLAGHVDIFVDRGAGRHKVMDWRAGDVTGVRPYSRRCRSRQASRACSPPATSAQAR